MLLHEICVTSIVSCVSLHCLLLRISFLCRPIACRILCTLQDFWPCFARTLSLTLSRLRIVGTGGPSDLNYFPIPLETSVTIGSTTPSPGFAPQDIRKGRQSQCTIQKPLHYGTTATYMRLLSITLLIFSVASPGLKVVFHPECVKDDFANFRIRRWVIRSACVQQAIAEREVNQNVNGSIQDGAAT